MWISSQPIHRLWAIDLLRNKAAYQSSMVNLLDKDPALGEAGDTALRAASRAKVFNDALLMLEGARLSTVQFSYQVDLKVQQLQLLQEATSSGGVPLRDQIETKLDAWREIKTLARNLCGDEQF